MNLADFEAQRPFCRGVVVRDLARRRSSWRSEADLDAQLRAYGIPGIAGIDTRKLTRRIRAVGAIPGAFGPLDADRRGGAPRGGAGRAGHRRDRPRRPGVHARALPPRRRRSVRSWWPTTSASSARSCATSRRGSTWRWCPRRRPPPTSWPASPPGCSSPTARAIPPPCRTPATPSRGCSATCPIFGICLGHQLLGRALGASTVKLPFGHHGGNHPVRNLATGRIEITSQNHNFAVDADSLGGRAEMSHVNLNDGVCEGLRVLDAPAFSVQHHPEAGPGPHDSAYLFEDFAALLGVTRSPRGSRRLPRRRAGGGLMPRRDDIESILLIGAGPIVIGQACEFDYSGTQACKVLGQEGYRVILANSNPATIMTDPEFAAATYVEPLDVDVLCRIIEREQPDAVLPTLGGQTALNLAMQLVERGAVDTPGTPELIGANAEAIRTAEDRELFKVAMQGIGLEVPPSGVAHSMEEAEEVAERHRPARRHPTRLHPGRQGHRHRHHARRVHPPGRQRHRGQPRERDPHRAVDRRVEGVRARGDARSSGQLRDHLLDREPRPDGRPHGRLDHGGARPDPQRRRVPAACATPPSRASAGSASRRAGRTCSSPSTPPTATWSSSR